MATQTTQINDNLEKQAEEIYRQSFMQENSIWPWAKLADFVEIKYGKDHRSLNEGTFPVYGSGGIMRFVDTPIYEDESVLIPRKGTLSNIVYINEPFWSVDTMFYTAMKHNNIAKYIYFFMRSVDLRLLNSGSAVPSMTVDILNSLKIKDPPKGIIIEFNKLVDPIFNLIFQLKREIGRLTQIRNVLLPKLMSGELDVSEIAI